MSIKKLFVAVVIISAIFSSALRADVGGKVLPEIGFLFSTTTGHFSLSSVNEHAPLGETKTLMAFFTESKASPALKKVSELVNDVLSPGVPGARIDLYGDKALAYSYFANIIQIQAPTVRVSAWRKITFVVKDGVVKSVDFTYVTPPDYLVDTKH